MRTNLIKSSKATRLNRFIGRVVKTRNPYILTLLYRSISRPILEYAALVWCPVLSTQQKTLEKVQRRFTRFCLGLPRRVLIDSVNEIEYSDRCVKLGPASFDQQGSFPFNYVCY